MALQHQCFSPLQHLDVFLSYFPVWRFCLDLCYFCTSFFVCLFTFALLFVLINLHMFSIFFISDDENLLFNFLSIFRVLIFGQLKQIVFFFPLLYASLLSHNRTPIHFFNKFCFVVVVAYLPLFCILLSTLYILEREKKEKEMRW